MKTYLFIVALMATSPVQAGGLSNVLINAGEIQRGMNEQQTPQRPQPEIPEQPRISCGPEFGNPGYRVRHCTATYQDGRQRQFTCTRTDSGVNCQ